MIYKCQATVNSKVNPTMDTLTFSVVSHSLESAYRDAIKTAFEAFKVRIPELKESEVSVDIASTNKF